MRLIKGLFNKTTVLFLLLLAMYQGFSQKVVDTIQLKEVEILGARLINGNQVVLEKRVLDESSLPDAGLMLRNIPGINGIKKGGANIDPLIRGFRFSQLNVIADDGVKIEGGCPNRMDPVTSHIQFEDITSVRVVKGPYSLRYGPALGGIIQLNTFSPEPFAKPELHARWHSGVSSNPEGFNQYLQVFGGTKKVYFSSAGGYSQYGNYSDGNGNKVKSSFTKYSYALDAGAKLSGNQELLVSFHRNFARNLMFPALPMDEIADNTTLLSADYHIQTLSKFIRKLDFKIYRSEVYHEMDNRFRPAYSIVTPPYSGLMQAVAKANASSTGGRVEMNCVHGRNDITLGTDLDFIAKDGSRVTTMIMEMGGNTTTSVKNSNLWKNAEIINTGIFAEYSVSLKKYKLMASARCDFNRAASADTLKLIKEGIHYFDNTNSAYINASANIGITHTINPWLTAAWYVGRGVRSPDMNERYIKYLLIGYDSYDYLGNPKLKPEVNYQTDIILNADLSRAGRFQVDIFYSLVDEYITGKLLPASVAMPKSMGAKGVKQFVNGGKATFTGFETTYNSQIYSGWAVLASTSLTYGVIHSIERNLFNENGQVIGTEEISYDAIQEIPPFETQLNVRYRFYKQKALIEAGSRFVAHQNHVSKAYYEESTPGFVLLNAMAKYNFSDKIRLVAGVQNILNKEYYEHLNRRIVGSTDKLYEAGRNFYLSLNIEI